MNNEHEWEKQLRIKWEGANIVDFRDYAGISLSTPGMNELIKDVRVVIESERQKAYEEGVRFANSGRQMFEAGRQAMVEAILAELPKEREIIHYASEEGVDGLVKQSHRFINLGFNECLSAIRDLIEKKLSN